MVEEKAVAVATLVLRAAAVRARGRHRLERRRTFLGQALDLHSARIRVLGRIKSGPHGRPGVGKAKVAATGSGYFVEHRHHDVRQGSVHSDGFC